MSVFDKEFRPRPKPKKKKKGITLPKVYRERSEMTMYLGKNLREVTDKKNTCL